MKNIPKQQPQPKIWQVKASAPELSLIFAHKLGIKPITAQLLINRGIYTVEQGRAFLGSELERLHSPHMLKDMKKAVDRVLKAAGSGEQILLYGDYDVDGITSTALLTRVLQRIGANVRYYLPHRLTEGYGLHLDVLQKAREKGVSLVVTLDCGISALEEALWAEENGLDLIISDHHEPPSELPRAIAIVNPKRQDCLYPFKELAGVGVALKMAQALLEEAGKGSGAWQDYLDLACLGTIADIVPVHGENRILVKHGLSRLACTVSPGLQALMAVSGVDKNTLSTRDVGFGLAPRLNAAGRLGSPEMALKLLLTNNPAEGWEIANELDRGNQERQKIESDVLEEALNLLQEKPGLQEAHVLVLASENWHPGVIGIVASRLTERFYRPVLLIAIEGGKGKGSARSIPGFHLYKALEQCRNYLLNYGGHAMAAGFAIDSGKIEGLGKEINCYAEKVLDEEIMTPRLELDGIIDAGQVSEELVKEIDRLRPFGHDNPRPLLCCRKAIILESRGVGRNANHLKLKLRVENKPLPLDGIGFNLGAYAETVATAEAVDLAFVPAINEYNGRRSIQLEVKDLGIPASLDLASRDERLHFDHNQRYLTDSLKTITDHQKDLFVPEFILEVLLNNYEASINKNNLLKNLFQGVALIDWRGIVNRPAQLVKLAGSGGPSLVITSCGYQTIELARFLQLASPALRDKTVCLHDAVPAEQRAQIAVGFQAGQIKTIIATPNAAGSVVEYAREVLLYHLPYSANACRCAVRAMLPDGSLHLLFGPEDLEDNKAGLEALAPDRNHLATFYRLLRREEKRGALEHLNLAEITQSMISAGFPHFHKYTAKTALDILEELRLLIKLDKQKCSRIKLLPTPSKKRDLRESNTYRHLQLIREESISWMEKLLSDPVPS